MNQASANRLILDLQIATHDENVPSEAQFSEWLNLAIMNTRTTPVEITLRLVGEEESHQLNAQFRNKNAPTNVLSFPNDDHQKHEVPFYGDIVVCAPVVEQEAEQQQKQLEAHWAHMVIHGMLHLQGYDHIDADEADEMEAIEVQLLTHLGFNNPYETNATENK